MGFLVLVPESVIPAQIANYRLIDGLIRHLDQRNQRLQTGQGSWPVNGQGHQRRTTPDSSEATLRLHNRDQAVRPARRRNSASPPKTPTIHIATAAGSGTGTSRSFMSPSTFVPS